MFNCKTAENKQFEYIFVEIDIKTNWIWNFCYQDYTVD